MCSEMTAWAIDSRQTGQLAVYLRCKPLREWHWVKLQLLLQGHRECSVPAQRPRRHFQQLLSWPSALCQISLMHLPLKCTGRRLEWLFLYSLRPICHPNRHQVHHHKQHSWQHLARFDSPGIGSALWCSGHLCLMEKRKLHHTKHKMDTMSHSVERSFPRALVFK